MPANLKWNGDRFIRLLKAELRRRVSACCHAVANRARELLSVEGTGKRTRRVRDKNNKLRQSRKLVYNANPSKPGEPPHVQTGRLRGSVAVEVQEGFTGPVGRVGTNVKYGRWLELATRLMAARPWLRRALQERAAVIKAIMIHPWRI